MSRIIPTRIANLVKEEHEKRGNKIYVDSKINNIQKNHEGFKIILENETIIDAQIIIAGIGSLPSIVCLIIQI